MAETGCLKDGCFQNLQIEGTTTNNGPHSTTAGAHIQKTATADANPVEFIFGKHGNIFQNVNPFILDGTSPKHVLGATLHMGSRIYKYAQMLHTAAAGHCLQHAAAVANHHNLTTAVNDAKAKTYTVTLGGTPATLNQYAEGYVHIHKADGKGQLLQIASHPAADASATLTLTLYDEVVVATTTSSKTDLVANPYHGLIVAPKTFTSSIVGISVCLGVSGHYGWVQVAGIASVAYKVNGAGDTIELGGKMIRSDELDGNVMSHTVAASSDKGHQFIGTAMVKKGTGDNIVIMMDRLA